MSSKGLASGGMEQTNKLFPNSWPNSWTEEEWRNERDSFIQEYQDFDSDDVALMLCCVSGNFPLRLEPVDESGTVRSALADALALLHELPATSSEWESEIPSFLASVADLAEEKAAQRQWSVQFDTVWDEIRGAFATLLEFFEQDVQTWESSRVSADADTTETLSLTHRLQSLLAEYAPIHERAASITEERERNRMREDLQPLILDALRGIEAVMSPSLGAEDDGSTTAVHPHPNLPPQGEGTSGETLPTGGAGAHEAAAPLVEDAPVAAQESSTPEPAPTFPSTVEATPSAGEANLNAIPEALPSRDVESKGPAVAVAEPLNDEAGASEELASLQTENLTLRDDAEALRSENQDLREEVEVLKTELFSAQEKEDAWRIAYISAKDSSSEELQETAPEIESVNGAVRLAMARFKQELLFAPNSESSIEENPFNDPQKVWEALHWLATTYYASRMGRLRVTDFDHSIKEACGWWYKGDQGETTLSRYEKSYTTRVDGKRHQLAEHIGKGTTFDARYTIRIAFSWDKDKRQVVIGYVGRHQQTDAS